MKESVQNARIPQIDMRKTGETIRDRLRASRISVREMQRRMELSCPQSLYRWIRGESLPSLEHLFLLSRILGCRMDDLIAEQQFP